MPGSAAISIHNGRCHAQRTGLSQAQTAGGGGSRARGAVPHSWRTGIEIRQSHSFHHQVARVLLDDGRPDRHLHCGQRLLDYWLGAAQPENGRANSGSGGLAQLYYGDMNLLRKTLGLVLVVDGLSAVLAPRKYLRTLQDGVPLVDDLLELLAERPDVARGLSAAEILIGAWLVVR